MNADYTNGCEAYLTFVKAHPHLKGLRNNANCPETYAVYRSGNWGTALWKELHTTAISKGLTHEYLNNFRNRIPSGMCGCKGHWDDSIKLNPTPFEGSKEEQFIWTFERHNEVNIRLKRPIFTLEEAKALFID